MQFPMNASIILVQLDSSDSVTAYVAYGPNGHKSKTTRVELKIGTMSDASDPEMWMQMCAASVCDAL